MAYSSRDNYFKHRLLLCLVYLFKIKFYKVLFFMRISLYYFCNQIYWKNLREYLGQITSVCLVAPILFLKIFFMIKLLEINDLLNISYWTNQMTKEMIWKTWIYFLLQLNEEWTIVNYVWKSTNIGSRMKDHKYRHLIQYTSWAFLEFDVKEIDYWEWIYILKYTPKFNQAYNYRTEFLTRKMLLKNIPIHFDRYNVMEYMKYTDHYILIWKTKYFSKSILLCNDFL